MLLAFLQPGARHRKFSQICAEICAEIVQLSAILRKLRKLCTKFAQFRATLRKLCKFAKQTCVKCASVRKFVQICASFAQQVCARRLRAQRPRARLRAQRPRTRRLRGVDECGGCARPLRANLLRKACAVCAVLRVLSASPQPGTRQHFCDDCHTAPKASDIFCTPK